MSSKRLRTKSVKVRDEEFTIREWTTAERREFVSRAEKNQGAEYLVHRCVLNGSEPLFATVEEVAEEPPELVDGLAEAILALSGAEVKKKGEEAPKG